MLGNSKRNYLTWIDDEALLKAIDGVSHKFENALKPAKVHHPMSSLDYKRLYLKNP